ncbi:MAG: hypothetical protein JXI32_05535 [Deltaproteobacteria bacterium]|nr:hypothetical protein [Deltaproteobacteria bacterium]
MRLRKEGVAALFLTVVFVVVCAFSASAAEFVYDKAPAFSVTYPEGWDPSGNTDVTFETKMGGSLPIMGINVKDVPDGVALADVNGKSFKALLDKAQDADSQVKETTAITLGCGTPASMSVLSWSYQGWMPLLTRIVSAYKDGKWVYVSLTTSDDSDKGVPQSLKFK